MKKYIFTELEESFLQDALELNLETRVGEIIRSQKKVFNLMIREAICRIMIWIILVLFFINTGGILLFFSVESFLRRADAQAEILKTSYEIVIRDILATFEKHQVGQEIFWANAIESKIELCDSEKLHVLKSILVLLSDTREPVLSFYMNVSKTGITA